MLNECFADIADYTAKYVNARTKFLFFLLVLLELWIVIAIFGLVIAVVFAMYPAAVLPVWFEVPIAVYLGYIISELFTSVRLDFLTGKYRAVRDLDLKQRTQALKEIDDGGRAHA